jgi:hypothetical protein
MYLMYVDESGDPGVAGSGSGFYILTGLIIHELSWQSALDDLVVFRKSIRDRYGWKLRTELHAQEMVNGRVSGNDGIQRNKRFLILRSLLDWIGARNDIGIITVVVEKAGYETPTEVFETGWKYLIQRFENTLQHRNSPGPQNAEDRGIVIPDNTNGEALRKLLRKMRRYNPVPSAFGPSARNTPIRTIIEDPMLRDSRDSFFIQLADVCAYFARQSFQPNKIVKKQGARHYYGRLEPAIIKKAAPGHPLGMVVAKKIRGAFAPPGNPTTHSGRGSDSP